MCMSSLACDCSQWDGVSGGEISRAERAEVSSLETVSVATVGTSVAWTSSHIRARHRRGDEDVSQ